LVQGITKERAKLQKKSDLCKFFANKVIFISQVAPPIERVEGVLKPKIR